MAEMGSLLVLNRKILKEKSLKHELQSFFLETAPVLKSQREMTD